MRQVFLIVVLVLGARCPATAADAFAVVLQERMPALLATNRVPGAVVTYITNGAVAWTKAFGLANIPTRTPMQADMLFNHGSDGKVLTAWGIMRLVEEGKLELDTPANRYLKRWQIRSTKFDPDGVTIRRLLSHTAGLTVHGFRDFKQGARLPTLVEILEGKNQNDGSVCINWQPGTTNVYSGGGFVLLQMILEDVSGEPFAAFIHRKVAVPLGLGSLHWVWTSQLERRAATPYDERQKPVGYRQLACQAIGSEICTVADFARFAAAAVPGPNGEPAGRGVLRPETVSAMIEPQSNGQGTGLAYGTYPFKGDKVLCHFGGNPGWSAAFVLAVKRREGLVIANNSSLGFALNNAVIGAWRETTFSPDNAKERR